jgi:hypothetical protein
MTAFGTETALVDKSPLHRKKTDYVVISDALQLSDALVVVGLLLDTVALSLWL